MKVIQDNAWDVVDPCFSSETKGTTASKATEVCSPSKQGRKHTEIEIRVRKENVSQSLGLFLCRLTYKGPILVAKVYKGPCTDTQLVEGMEVLQINEVDCQGMPVTDVVQLCKEAQGDISILARLPKNRIIDEAQWDQLSELLERSESPPPPPNEKSEQEEAIVAETSSWWPTNFQQALFTEKEEMVDKATDLKTSNSDSSTGSDTSVVTDNSTSLSEVGGEGVTPAISFGSLGRCGFHLLLDACEDDESSISWSTSSCSSTRRRRKLSRLKKRRGSPNSKRTRRQSSIPSREISHCQPIDNRRRLV
eukprot:scaffold1183_cov114-Cylindrotheca_fusiformis.AAC.5